MNKEENIFILDSVFCKTEKVDDVDMLSVNDEDLQDVKSTFSPKSSGSINENVPGLEAIEEKEISECLLDNLPCKPEIEDEVDNLFVKVEENFRKEENEHDQGTESCSSTRATRGIAYTTEEKDILKQLIIKYPVIEEKKSDATSIRRKTKAWNHVMNEYNAFSGNIKRSVLQLKRCWDKMKRIRKVELAEERRQQMADCRDGG